MLSNLPPILRKRLRFEAYAETSSALELPTELLQPIKETIIHYDTYVDYKVAELLANSYVSALNAFSDQNRRDSIYTS